MAMHSPKATMYEEGSYAHRLHHEGHHLVTGDEIGPDLAPLVWLFERPLLRLVEWLAARLPGGGR